MPEPAPEAGTITTRLDRTKGLTQQHRYRLPSQHQNPGHAPTTTQHNPLGGWETKAHPATPGHTATHETMKLARQQLASLPTQRPDRHAESKKALISGGKHQPIMVVASYIKISFSRFLTIALRRELRNITEFSLMSTVKFDL